MPLEHVSISQCRKFRMCALQWKYHYIDHLAEPVSARMLLGIAVHEGLAKANLFRQAELDTSTDACMSEIVDATHAEALKTIEGKEVAWEKGEVESMDALMTRATKILHRAVPSLDIECGVPVHIEAKLPDLVLSCGVPLLGYADLVTEDGDIYDFKVGAKAKSQTDVDQDLQLSIYAERFTEKFPTKGVSVHLVSVNSENGTVKKVSSKRTKQKAAAAIAEIDSTARMMQLAVEHGVFPANTEGWHCSEKFCGAWKVCPHGGGK